jgi:hypothetical protein
MEARDQKKIREEIRETYGKVAKAGGVYSGPSQTASCCGPSNTSAGANQAASCGCGVQAFP